MAGPLNYSPPQLSNRDCECDQNVTFYVVLGATIVISILNILGGIAFCLWRRRRSSSLGWSDEKAPHQSMSKYALPHPSIHPTDIISPRMSRPQNHHNVDSDPLRVLVSVSEQSDAHSDHGPPPRRRSGSALMAKILGHNKQCSGATTTSNAGGSILRHPEESVPSPPPVITNEPRTPGYNSNRVLPNPRNQSLSPDSNYHPRARPSQSKKRVPKDSQPRIIHEEIPVPNPIPEIIPDSSTPSNLPPPPLRIPVPRYLQLDDPYTSPLTPSTAPSTLFTGSNAPRALSFVWPKNTIPASAGALLQSSNAMRKPIHETTKSPVSAPLASRMEISGSQPSPLPFVTSQSIPSRRYTQATHAVPSIPPSPRTAAPAYSLAVPSIPPSPRTAAPAPPSPDLPAPSSPLRLRSTSQRPPPLSTPPRREIHPVVGNSRPISHHSFDPDWKWKSSISESRTIHDTPKNGDTKPAHLPISTLLSQPISDANATGQSMLAPPTAMDRHNRPLPRVPNGPRAQK